MPSEIRAVFVSLTVLSAMRTSEKKVHIWDGDHDDEDGDFYGNIPRVHKNNHSSGDAPFK